MTLKHDLATQLGRAPTKAELKAAKAAALSAVASDSGPNATAEPNATSFVLQLVAKETVDDETKLAVAHGQFTKRNMLVSYKGNHVITTLEDVRTKAKKSFEVNSDNGLRVYLGESLSDLVFISDETEWRDEIYALIRGSTGTLPSRTLFVLEVMPSHENALIPRRSVKNGATPTTEVQMQTGGIAVSIKTTPVELEKVVARALASAASNPRGSGGGAWQAVSKGGSGDGSDSDSDSDSEDETVGAAAGPLLYTMQVLKRYNAQLLKAPYLQPNGKPMYSITTGAVGAGKEYIPFDVTKLKETDLVASGALRKGMLYLGSMVPSDRVRGMTYVEAPKFLIRVRAGKRAIGKDKRPIYASLGELVDPHRKRVQAAQAGTPRGATPFADKGMQVSIFASVFTSAAAVAQQATKRLALLDDSPGIPSPRSPIKVSTDVDAPANPEVLVMPPLTPAANSYEELRRARITLSELIAAKTPGMCVSESVVDALCRHEELIFRTRARELNLEHLLEVVTVVRMADSAWLVEMATKHGTEPLKDTTIVVDLKKDGAGFYDKLRREIGLGTPHNKLLVPFGLVGNTHFSMGFYLPQTEEIVRVDSHRPSKHEELMASYYGPFFEFVHEGALDVTSKDDRSGIEKQPGDEDANACGFAAPLFLSKAFTALLEITETAKEPMALPALGAALSKALREMVASASSYKVHRRVCKHDLSRLAIEYKEIRAAREKAKAEGPAAGTAAKPAASAAQPASTAAKPAASAAKPAASDDDEIYKSSSPPEVSAKPAASAAKPAASAAKPGASAAKPAASATKPAATKPSDDLQKLIEAKRKRKADIQEMKATVAEDMKKAFDTGVKVNPELAAHYAKKAKTSGSLSSTEPYGSDSPSDSDLELSDSED